MRLIAVELPDEGGGESLMERLGTEVRNAAYQGSEELWSAVLEVLDTDAARTLERALGHLYDMDSAGDAMKLVFALYGLCEMAVPKEIDACDEYPALARLFMDEFLAETDEYLTDVECEELEDAVMKLD